MRNQSNHVQIGPGHDLSASEEVSPVAERESPSSQKRPQSLSVPTPWRDQLTAPSLTITKTDGHTARKRASSDPSTATCRDHGDSAQLVQQVREDNELPDSQTSLSTTDLLHGVGALVDASLPIPTYSAPTKSEDCPLEVALREATLSPKNDGNKFIPLDKFVDIINKDAVREKLSALSPQLRPSLDEEAIQLWTRAIFEPTPYMDPTTGRRMLTTRRKILSILILCAKPEAIFSFVEEGLFDKDLPFKLEQQPPEPAEQFWWSPQGTKTSRLVSSLQDWRRSERDSFDQYQWYMLSPFFDMKKVEFYNLERRIVLPFIDDRRGKKDWHSGGFSEVWRVSIHPAHHNLSKGKSGTLAFAVKRLRGSDDDDDDIACKQLFEREVAALKRFSDEAHLHLTRLLTTYKLGSRYHLIFPWADHNLREFWKMFPSPQKSRKQALWLVQQCRSVAKGLSMIHSGEFGDKRSKREHLKEPEEAMLGTHGDIKPENVLWYADHDQAPPTSDSGVLKIADFGLTRFHRHMSTAEPSALWQGLDRTYRAPEFDLHRPISRTYDIWALGCLYLEFLTWYLCGWEAVDEFSASRTRTDLSVIREDNYFQNYEKKSKYGASLKLCVVYWINKLHHHDSCTDFVHDFLYLISFHLLRVRSEIRMSSKSIVSKLDELHRSCEENTAYCTEACPTTPAHPQKQRTNDSDAFRIYEMKYTEEWEKDLMRRSTIKSIETRDDALASGIVLIGNPRGEPLVRHDSFAVPHPAPREEATPMASMSSTASRSASLAVLQGDDPSEREQKMDQDLATQQKSIERLPWIPASEGPHGQPSTSTGNNPPRASPLQQTQHSDTPKIVECPSEDATQVQRLQQPYSSGHNRPKRDDQSSKQTGNTSNQSLIVNRPHAEKHPEPQREVDPTHATTWQTRLSNRVRVLRLKLRSCFRG